MQGAWNSGAVASGSERREIGKDRQRMAPQVGNEADRQRRARRGPLHE